MVNWGRQKRSAPDRTVVTKAQGRAVLADISTACNLGEGGFSGGWQIGFTVLINLISPVNGRAGQVNWPSGAGCFAGAHDRLGSVLNVSTDTQVHVTQTEQHNDKKNACLVARGLAPGYRIGQLLRFCKCSQLQYRRD